MSLPAKPEVPSTAFETGRGVVFPWLCDPMGHMATQHYMAFYDSAFYHVMAHLGDAGAMAQRGWADVQHTVEYHHELVAGDLVVLMSVIASLGTKSLTHRTYMLRQSDLRICSIVECVSVRLDLAQRTAVPIEAAIREAAAVFLAPPTGAQS